MSNNQQESVWDYPRPPRLERSPKHIQIIFNGVTIARQGSRRAVVSAQEAPDRDIRRPAVAAEKFSVAAAGHGAGGCAGSL